MNFKPDIDLRGERGEAAIGIIQTFIDEAIMFEVGHLRILHGKGNGILRQITRDYLRSVKEVKKYQDAPLEQGGAGITIINFK